MIFKIWVIANSMFFSLNTTKYAHVTLWLCRQSFFCTRYNDDLSIFDGIYFMFFLCFFVMSFCKSVLCCAYMTSNRLGYHLFMLFFHRTVLDNNKLWCHICDEKCLCTNILQCFRISDKWIGVEKHTRMPEVKEKKKHRREKKQIYTLRLYDKQHWTEITLE